MNNNTNHLGNASPMLKKKLQRMKHAQSGRNINTTSPAKEVIRRNKLEQEIKSKQKKLLALKYEFNQKGNEPKIDLSKKIEELDDLIEKWRSSILSMIDVLKEKFSSGNIKLIDMLKGMNINYKILDIDLSED